MKKNKIFKTESLFKKILSITFFILISVTSSYSQQKVTGVVTDSVDGFPIIGATVNKLGTKVFATTDFDGVFEMKAKDGDVLRFTYLGMAPKTVTVKGVKLTVVLEPESTELDEVVVIGYGKVTKKEVTGAVTQLKAEDIEDFVTPDLASALEGQVAGVNISSNSGEPGEPASITIRGVSSLTGDSNPLFVVDGIPFDGDPNINPNEIETIDILKDAASASIYGTRGAGGVIIITTKKGKEGNNSIEVNARVGVQSIPTGDFVDRANTREQVFINSISNRVGALNDITASRFALLNDTDILDEVLNDQAVTQDYSVRFFGGSKSINYSVTAGYFNQEAIVQGSELDRYNTRANLSIKKNKWKINNGFALTVDNRKILGQNLIQNALNFSAFLPSITFFQQDLEGLRIANGPSTNRAVNLIRSLDANNTQDRYRVSFNNKIDYSITKSLSVTNFVGYSFTQLTSLRATSTFQLPSLRGSNLENIRAVGSVANGSIRTRSLNWNGGLNYDKKIGKHSIKVTTLASLEQFKDDSFAVSRFDLLPGASGVLSNAVGNFDGSSTVGSRNIPFNFVRPDIEINRVGLIGRLQYNYDKKYLVSLSARRDGSSQFGLRDRYNTFPSVSLAWNVAEEEFWSPYKSVVNNFKLRANRGTTGNDRFQAFQFLATGTVNNINASFDNGVDVGIAIPRLTNDEIKWETTIQNNFGVDLSFFKNAITLSAEYYTTKKEDLLLPVQLPSSGGTSVPGNGNFSTNTVFNVGDLRNSGVELAFNYKGRYKKWNWRVGGTFTQTNSEIEKLAPGIQQQQAGRIQLFNAANTQNFVFLAEGHEPGSFLLYRTDGVFNDQQELDEYNNSTDFTLGPERQLGDLKYVDTNGDGVLDERDREIRGSGIPKYEVGLNLNAGYKNWNLSTSWFGAFGAEVINGARANAFNEGNARELVFQFSENNPSSNLPVLDNPGIQNINYAQNTDLFLENGDFIRLRNVTLSYKLPKKIVKTLALSNVQFTLSGQNLVTFTKYSGFNPSVGGNNITRRGVDVSRVPLARLYNLGVKIKF